MMKMTVAVADVLDGRTFRVSSGSTMILKDVEVPSLLTLTGQRAKARLEELILRRHVECEVFDSDIEGRFLAQVRVEDKEVNQVITRLVAEALSSRESGDAGNAESDAKPKPTIEVDESRFR